MATSSFMMQAQHPVTGVDLNKFKQEKLIVDILIINNGRIFGHPRRWDREVYLEGVGTAVLIFVSYEGDLERL